MEAHKWNFVFNVLHSGKPVQLLRERWWVAMMRCHEDESCSKVLNSLERLDDRIGCVWLWVDSYSNQTMRGHIRGNKSFDCAFSEISADWTNAWACNKQLNRFWWCVSLWKILSQEWIQGSWHNQRKECCDTRERKKKKKELLFCHR